jgi:hypothetical protein
MDQKEAEWLMRLIRREPEKWIEAVAVEYNQDAQQHEVLCHDPTRGLSVWIETPRQWVKLKYQRRGPHNAVAAL